MSLSVVESGTSIEVRLRSRARRSQHSGAEEREDYEGKATSVHNPIDLTMRWSERPPSVRPHFP